MSDLIYTCRNRHCKGKDFPAYMLGANPRCPMCSRWMRPKNDLTPNKPKR